MLCIKLEVFCQVQSPYARDKDESTFATAASGINRGSRFNEFLSQPASRHKRLDFHCGQAISPTARSWRSTSPALNSALDNCTDAHLPHGSPWKEMLTGNFLPRSWLKFKGDHSRTLQRHWLPVICEFCSESLTACVICIQFLFVSLTLVLQLFSDLVIFYWNFSFSSHIDTEIIELSRSCIRLVSTWKIQTCWLYPRWSDRSGNIDRIHLYQLIYLVLDRFFGITSQLVHRRQAGRASDWHNLQAVCKLRW